MSKKLNFATHESLGQSLGAFVDIKNQAYQNSFDKVGRIMDIILEDIPPEEVKKIVRHIVFTGRVLDKLIRNLRNQAKGGDMMQEDPTADAIGYLLLDIRSRNLKADKK